MPVTTNAIRIEKLLDCIALTNEEITELREAGYILRVDNSQVCASIPPKYYFKVLGHESNLEERQADNMIYRQLLEANQMILAYVENIDTRLKAIEGKFL